jgi:hypothetical protein
VNLHVGGNECFKDAFERVHGDILLAAFDFSYEVDVTMKVCSEYRLGDTQGGPLVANRNTNPAAECRQTPRFHAMMAP